MVKRVIWLAMAALAVALAACSPSGGAVEEPLDDTTTVPPVGTPLQEPTAAEPLPTESAPTEGLPTGTSPAEPTAEGGAGLSSGEVPQALFDAVLADALARSGATQSAVTVQMAQQVEWSDGSMGCPAPDMMYTQAIVSGYQVIFEIGGQTYDYHLSDSGIMILCANGLPELLGG